MPEDKLTPEKLADIIDKNSPLTREQAEEKVDKLTPNIIDKIEDGKHTPPSPPKKED